MSALILPAWNQSSLGNPSIRTSTSHKVYAWRHLKFFAQQGRIKIVNEQDGEANDCSRRDFILRAMGMNDALAHMDRGHERGEHHRLVELMQLCIRDAQEQGDPHIPEQLADKLKGGRGKIVVGGMAPPSQPPLKAVYPDGKEFNIPTRVLETPGITTVDLTRAAHNGFRPWNW